MLIIGLWLASTAVTCDVNRNTGIGPSPLDRILVRSVTTGTSVDPDGYIVTLDPGIPEAVSFRIADNDSVAFGADGTHFVLLSDIASNCTVSGNNPETVTVPLVGVFGRPSSAYVTFRVTCVAAE